MFDTRVRWNRQITGRFHKLALEFSGPGASAISQCRPGQFIEIDIAAALPTHDKIPGELSDCAGRNLLLRRPFSPCDITKEADKTLVELLYCVVGPATLRMTTLTVGNSVSVIGPLGNGFSVPANKTTALLVAGGMGAPPLLHLAKTLTTEHPQMQVVAFAGAKTANGLPFEKRLDRIAQDLGFSIQEFAKFGIESLIATDDGSAGFHGLVTDCLLNWLTEHNPAANSLVIYACGPEPMLASVADIGRQKNIDCQVSMERLMACGIGVCQSCAVECRADGSNETIYKLCCKDGPVFDVSKVIFKS